MKTLPMDAITVAPRQRKAFHAKPATGYAGRANSGDRHFRQMGVDCFHGIGGKRQVRLFRLPVLMK